MLRFSKLPLMAALALPVGWIAGAEPGSSTPPLTYELMINGETFLIESGRQHHLQSRRSPGTTYDVALRIAMTQPVKLDTFRFEYRWPAQVELDRRGGQQSVRIRHELGYTLLISDLGRPDPARPVDETLKIVRESVVEGLRESGIDQIDVGPAHSHPFPAAAGRGVVIRYRGKQGSDQTCLVYLLTGEQFVASCVVQYFDAQAEDVLPQVRKTLNAIRPIQ